MPAIFTPADYFRELRRDEVFPNSSRPLEIDLGCGEGSFLVEMARLYPQRDFLGVERLLGRVTKTARKIQAAGLTNAKVMRLDSSYAVGWLLPTAGVSRLHLLCPDPWPKQRHRKNRLVNDPEFLAGLERIIAPGGDFLLKTDHEGYFENAIQNLAERAGFERLDWMADGQPYPMTDFERQWLDLGMPIHRARWRRH